MRLPRRVVPAALMAVLAATTASCVAPSRTTEDYTLKAANTASAMTSAVQTALLVAHTAGAGRLPAPAASRSLDEAESDAASIQGTFDSVQPPDARADQLRDELDEVLTSAVDGIAALRITARRGQLDRLPATARPLRDVVRRLSKLGGAG